MHMQCNADRQAFRFLQRCCLHDVSSPPPFIHTTTCMHFERKRK